MDQPRELTSGRGIGGVLGAELPAVAAKLARSLLQFYSEPGHQAFLAGAFLTAGLTHRMRTLPAFICTFIGGVAAEQAYLAMRDVRESTAAIKILAARLEVPGEPGGLDHPQP